MNSIFEPWGRSVALFAVLGLLAVTFSRGQADPAASVTHVPVVFSGGHETVGEDRGRPVILIAGALGVPPEVFRAAFRQVRPAPAGTAPDPEQVQRNKAALLAALSPYGVTNERLDEVSNYYRYQRSRGELWPTQPAAAYVVVSGGRVTGFVVTSGGSGYSSPPTVVVPGLKDSAVSASLAFSTEFEHNGAVADISIQPGENR